MKIRAFKTAACLTVLASFSASTAFGQMGRTWPSEKKIVPDPVTGLPLEFLTSTDTPGYTQSKIYQTHRQWTSDGKWLIFRGSREGGSQAFAVNEETGLIVQVTETGFTGMLCAGNKTMKLYVMAGGGGGGEAGARRRRPAPRQTRPGERRQPQVMRRPRRRAAGAGAAGGPRQILEIDLEKLLRRRGRRDGEASGQLHPRLRHDPDQPSRRRQHGVGRQ